MVPKKICHDACIIRRISNRKNCTTESNYQSSRQLSTNENFSETNVTGSLLSKKNDYSTMITTDYHVCYTNDKLYTTMSAPNNEFNGKRESITRSRNSYNSGSCLPPPLATYQHIANVVLLSRPWYPGYGH